MSPRAFRTLSTADERRLALVASAVTVFAQAGLHATPITAVAQHAGISPAYAFKLFPGKVDLFVAAIDDCYARIDATLRATAARSSATGGALLDEMGDDYAALIADRTLLMLQVHAQAAATDARVRDAVRAGVARVTATATELTGAEPERIQRFLAYGQLCHLLTTLDAFSLDADWARTATAGITHV